MNVFFKRLYIYIMQSCVLLTYRGTFFSITFQSHNQTYTDLLKTVDTIGNCQRPVFSLSVSQHMHKITNLWKFEIDWSSELRDNYERKKHPRHTKLWAFRCLISRPQILNLRSRNQILWNIRSFSKTTSLQREPFLTMFYTINLSPVLITK